MEQTKRGFNIIKFKDSYSRLCSLQDSSAATLGHIWLGLDNVDHDEMGGRMHLSRTQVAELLPYLQQFVATGSIWLPEGESPKPATGLIRDMLENLILNLPDLE